MNKLQELVYDICLKVVKRQESIFIIIWEGETSGQKYSGLNALENPKEFEKLCAIGGQILLNEDGIVLSYGYDSDFPRDKGMCFQVSRETNKVLVFKEGKTVLDIDPKEPEVKKSKNVILEILESVGVGTVGTIGTGILIPALGLTFFPGLILFGSAYIVGKKLMEKK